MTQILSSPHPSGLLRRLRSIVRRPFVQFGGEFWVSCRERLSEKVVLIFAIVAMPAKSRFTRLDAFTKTVDEARIRTTSGGIVTIVSLVVVLFLSWGEWADYRRIVIHPELVVDKGRGMRSASQ